MANTPDSEYPFWYQEPDNGFWTLATEPDPCQPGHLADCTLSDDELEAWPPYVAARNTASLAGRLVEVLASDYPNDDHDARAHLEQLGVDGVLQAMIDSHAPPALAQVIDLPTPTDT